MNNRLGVCVIGSNGAVATTAIAGIELMKKNLVPRRGMITERELGKVLDLVPIDSIVIGGWDLRSDNAYEAALHHGVIQRHLIDQVKQELMQVRPWAATTLNKSHRSQEQNLVLKKSIREELKHIEQDIQKFKALHQLDRIVLVNLISVEKFSIVEDVHATIEAFEKGLDSDDERISPSMKYLYVACKMQIPFVNFTPNLTKIPALEHFSEKCGIPIAGEDGKTGQTLIKTVLAPMFAIRDLQVDGWFSTNILGNNDGLILNDPSSNKTKVMSKEKVLDSILGYKVDNHQVHIHYYKPRGDAKEAWDNIDVSGFLGENMQIKIDFLCKDSILAAPLVIDLVRLLDFAKRNGEAGIQRQFSFFFKAPYHAEGEAALHDFFKQYDLFKNWVQKSLMSSKKAKAPSKEELVCR